MSKIFPGIRTDQTFCDVRPMVYSNLMKLIRSKDRKVTNAVSPNGKTAVIANSFGLPAGKNYSCPSATSVCEKVCYAGKLEKIYKGVRDVLTHNFELLRNSDETTMVSLLQDMIDEFKLECDKRSADKLFRIHWDGDFFSPEYTQAWKTVITQNTDVQFWVYTRVKTSAVMLKGIENLSLYFSTDSENKDTAIELSKHHEIKLAYLADTFAIGKQDFAELLGKTAIPCPENAKKIPLISQKGSACVSCGQCVFNRNDILFSVKKK